MAARHCAQSTAVTRRRSIAALKQKVQQRSHSLRAPRSRRYVAPQECFLRRPTSTLERRQTEMRISMKTKLSKMARIAAVAGVLGLGATSFAVAQTADRGTTDGTTGTMNRDDHTDMGWV